MVTVLRAGGMRFVIHLDGHEPAHVHVHHDGGEARMDVKLVAAISNRGMKKRDLARALAIVLDRRRFFLEKREDIHG